MSIIDEKDLLMEIFKATNKNTENIATLLERSDNNRREVLKASSITGLVFTGLTTLIVKYLELYK